MRYMLITYVRRPNGQIDEQVGFAKRVKDRDWQTCNVIMDYAERKVLRCLIEGKVVDTDFDKLHTYYKEVYPSHINELMRMNGLTDAEPTTETPETPETAESTVDATVEEKKSDGQ